MDSHPSPPFPCDQCSKSFGNLRGLKTHRGMKHKSGRHSKRRRDENGEAGQQIDAENTSTADAMVADLTQDPRVAAGSSCSVDDSGQIQPKRRREENGGDGQWNVAESTSADVAVVVDSAQDQLDVAGEQNAAVGSSSVDDGDVDMEQDQRPLEESSCPICGVFNARKKSIKCYLCGCMYHRACVDVTQVQANVFSKYTCRSCRYGTAPICGPSVNDPPGNPDFKLLDHLITCKSNLSILGNIPRGARITVANALNELICNVLRSNTALAWSKLLCFTHHCLQKPKKDKPASNNPSLVTKIKNQVSVFMNSPFPPFEFPFALRKKNSRPKSQDEILKDRVNAKFAENDLRGAIRELSSDDTLAPDNDETLEVLGQKHPLAPVGCSSPPVPEKDVAHVPISSDSVKTAILSFPAGSAGGPDGLKPGHLKNLIGATEAGNKLLVSLTKLVNFILQEQIPADIRPIFFGANLFALSKKDGGIRPIAVGLTLRRLTTKVGLKPLSQGLGSLLRPNQLGFATKGGSEAAAHAARHYLNNDPQNKVFLKLDIKNAFNSMHRDVFLEKVKEEAPSLYNLAWQAYSSPSHLFYREKILVSETGIQQGDPSGPALFSLGLDRIIKNLKSELNLWYLDDSNMADSPQIVLEDLRSLLSDLKKIGLSLNPIKCELTCLNLKDPISVADNFRNLLPGLKITSTDDLVVLGSPIADQGVRSEIVSKQNALEKMISRLNLIDPHQAFVLLKNSCAIPKLTYLLRSSPAYRQSELLRDFDLLVKDAVSSITNVDFSAEGWTQASLPVRSGGLGIRKTVDIALPCYISSAFSVHPIVEASLSSVHDLAPFEVSSEVELWELGSQGLAAPVGDSRSSQRAWDAPRAERIQESLLEDADQFSRARLLASAKPESGSWVSAIPVPSLGTQLSPEELRIAIALRTGSKVSGRHLCKCGFYTDEFGFHLLSCRFSEGRHPRHTAMNDIIWRALRATGLIAIQEPVGINRGDGKRPDGITVGPFSQGKLLVWDATCSNTFAESSVNESAVEAGRSALKAEISKRAKYPDMVRNYMFEPIAIETSGVYGPSTKIIIQEIGKRISQKSGDKRETMWLKQRLSIAIQRGNALSILSLANLMTGHV